MYPFKDEDAFINIAADRMEERDGFIRVFNGENLVAVVDMGVLKSCHFSGGDNKSNGISAN